MLEYIRTSYSRGERGVSGGRLDLSARYLCPRSPFRTALTIAVLHVVSSTLPARKWIRNYKKDRGRFSAPPERFRQSG
jgi:hypothetical protein